MVVGLAIGLLAVGHCRDRWDVEWGQASMDGWKDRHETSGAQRKN